MRDTAFSDDDYFAVEGPRTDDSVYDFPDPPPSCAGAGVKVSGVVVSTHCPVCGLLIYQKEGVFGGDVGLNTWALPEHPPSFGELL